MTIKPRHLGVVALAAALAACSAITPVGPGPLPLQGGRQVALSRQWSDVSAILPQRAKKVRVLSVDGPMLNRLYLAEGLSPGEGLLTRASKEHPAPTFKSDMSLTELVEFTADSVTLMGYQRVATSALRPGKFGADDAIRFEIDALTESGLEMKGVAMAATSKGRLYLLVYLAPAEHYFAATLPEVEAILKSAS